MKHLLAIAAAGAMIFLPACSSDDPITVPDEPEKEVVDAPEIANPSEYHEKYRTVPYPRSSNELFVNPAPLIVPQSMKTGSTLQFAISSSPAFDDANTEMSDPVEWNMYNLHHSLDAGHWYWRFRNLDAAGNPGQWSETYDFEVTGAEPVFVTPDWDYFLSMAPKQQAPRYYCFLDGKLAAAREHAEEHTEYRSLISRAASALATDYSTQLRSLYSTHDALYSQVEYMYQAYLLTRDEQYAAKLISLLDAMLASPCPSSILYADDFNTSTVTYAHAAVLDLLGDRLTDTQRRGAINFIEGQCRRFFASSCGSEENHIFNNHFWQINFRLMFFSALTLYDNPACPQSLRLLEYLYELWTARAPASGFNRDGLWHNGTGYFTTNTKTLAYMALMLSYITRTDFTQHPWYRNAGQAMAYTMPPVGDNVGFGDGQEKNPEPNRQMAAFADFLARETGDAYAAWWAQQRPDLVHDDWELRIYRMCNADTYNSDSSVGDMPMLKWYHDSGEVAIHTDLSATGSDLALGFRSSQFGSGSHTTSSQNAFNLLFGGGIVFRSSGYYQNFSDAHNLMSYRHTRAHNSVLIDGIGQPFSTSAYGRILRAASGANIAYALGDASNAYCGISEDPMWIRNFANAGIEQTPENGFGPTPLTRYFRHIAVLQPGIVVIYDELEASRAASWQWLLHSPVQFDIDAKEGTLHVVNRSMGNQCYVTIACSATPEMSQTSQFRVPPATQGPDYPDWWHFTAEVTDRPAVRFLTIMVPGADSDELAQVERDGDTFRIEGWEISANLDPATPATLNIVNAKRRAALNLGTAPQITVGDAVYSRGYTASTMIVDRMPDGSASAELVDVEPISSRMR